MSSDWWLNNIGSFATASTPSGSVPQYGVAYDIGTAAWPNAQSAQDFVSVTAKRTHAPEIQKIAAAKQQDDEGWFQKGLGLFGHGLEQGLGFITNGPFHDYSSDPSKARAEMEASGAQDLQHFGSLPGVKQAGQAINFASNVLETPFIMDKNVGVAKNFGLWTDKSAWGKAWQMADDRSLPEALLDDILVGTQGVKSDADLDRIRRTNSLYGMASFAGDLYLGAKLDPTVFMGKGLGEARRLAAGELPAETSSLRAEAQRVARGEAAKKTVNPLTRYASYRGAVISHRFEDLRDYAQTHSLTDMTGLNMFRRKAVNGAQAALAFKIAAKDDTLWDLTQRAVLADPVAWKQIRDLKNSVPADLKAYAPADTRTYLDAIDATKTKMKQLENEVNDLDKLIAQREQTPLSDVGNVGMFRHYTWELHRDMEAKKADIDEIAKKLEGHQDYGDWLGNMPHVYGDDIYRGPVMSIDQVSLKGKPLDDLTQHTYQNSAYGAVHQISQISKGAYLQKANPIDLNRVDSGVESIRRQFEQLNHLMGYKNPEGLDSAIESFVRAPDQFTRFKVAKQIEDEHLVGALSQKFGLERDTVDLFLNQSRLRKNEMINALLSGEGAVYSTGSLMDRAKILKRDHGMAEIEVMDNGKRVTMRVPEEALEPQTLPVDPTQTPNTYMPMDTRQVYLAVKRNNELFEALDDDVRQFGAKRTAKTMNAINAAGNTFNQLWKPVQLFRLAWPQRVIMDEGLRSLAMVGSNMFARNFGAAMRDAAANALNPYEHGYFLHRQRKLFKAGPGPVTDGAFGKDIDTPTHEAEAEVAPVVPSRFAPQRNKGRSDMLGRQVSYNAEAKRIRDRHAALAREGIQHNETTPDFDSPMLSRLQEITDPKGPNVGTFDPVTGKKTQSGWAVPVYESTLRETDDSLLYFIEKNQELLASNGYRVTLENTPKGRVAKVVRVFRKNDVQKASDFASHVEGDLIDVESGHNVFRRQHGPERPVLEEETPDLGSFEDPEFPDKLNAWAERKRLKRRQYGKGTETWKSGDGKKITVNSAFEGPAEVYTNLISSNPVYTRLTDTYKRTLSKYRERAAGYKATPAPDMSPEALKVASGRKAALEYLDSWSTMLNDQIRNSPIWVRMLKGQSDDEILHWLTSTDEGARLRMEMPHMGHKPEKWVEEHRQRLNAYLPDKNLQAIAAEREIRPDELRRIPAELQPTIYEPDLQMVSGRGEIAKFVSDHVERIYHALGTVPSDLLVRQPFFKSLYDLKMRNLVKATDSEELTNDVLRGYERLAREFALRQVKKNLYDLADETNFTQAVRFLAPFWGAQQEAMVKWLNIAIEKPETVAKFYVGVNQTYNHFQVIDEDGKPTDSPHNLFNYNPNDRVILQIPKALTDHAPFKGMLKEFGSVGVAFGAANTALQGDNPLIPSLGPLVTMPADVLVNKLWDTHGTQFDDNFFYRWLFPVGRPQGGVSGKLEQLFPGWGRRMSALEQGQDSRMYANTFWSVYRELDLDHRKRGLPPPTMDEVQKAANWHMGLRVLASFAMPAAMEFRPKHQLFLDKYHEMQDLYGPDAFEMFVKKYGADAARYATSSSNSPVGVPPTAKAMDEWSQNKALIQQFPDWGGAIISPAAWADDFSSDAYGAQFDIKLGPGTKQTIRESTDPQERIAQTDTRLGWLEYRQLSSSIDAELANRGLHSIQQVGAEDIQDMKRAAVKRLSEKYPAWATDYNTFENTIYQKVGQLETFAFDPQFDNRPDFQGVRQYLMLRRATAQSLDAYAAETGGSRSLQAQENSQLRDWFNTQVGDLIQQNPAFGEFYHRYLESDRLERGSG